MEQILYFVLTLVTGFGFGIIWGAFFHERYVEDIEEDYDEESKRFIKWTSRSKHED